MTDPGTWTNLNLCRKLTVNNVGLEGAIPRSFSDLTALTYLDLSVNSAITKLSYFGNLKKLACVLPVCQCACPESLA
jgi:hypothetical protein